MFHTKKRTFEQHHNENITYYQFSTTNTVNHKKLNENINTDICVIGGGLTGLSSALHLSNKGYLNVSYLCTAKSSPKNIGCLVASKFFSLLNTVLLMRR